MSKQEKTKNQANDKDCQHYKEIAKAFLESLQNAKEAILIVKPLKDQSDFKIIYFNQQCLNTFSIIDNGNFQPTLLSLLPERETGILLQTYFAVLSSGEPIEKDVNTINMPYICYDWINIYASRLSDGLKIKISNVTIKKIFENQITQTNRELEHFIYSVSHDLQSPLVTIEGFSSLILEGLEQETKMLSHCSSEEEHIECINITEDITNWAQEIQNAVKTLSQKIESLLRLSRVGRLHSNREWLMTKELINDCLSLNKDQFEKYNVKVNVEINVSQFYAQKEIMHSILDNLLNNAIKYAKPKRNNLIIWLRINSKNSHLVIEIEDNGIGIPEQDRDKIFQPFYRLTNTGTGLGLSIVKKGVEFHGGHIFVMSGKEDQGALFRIILPHCVTKK